MTSTERIIEYKSLPSEQETVGCDRHVCRYHVEDPLLDRPQWPEAGEVRMEDLRLSYGKDTPQVGRHTLSMGERVAFLPSPISC